MDFYSFVRLHGSLTPPSSCPGGALQGHRHLGIVFSC